ncbi:snare associated Golgi protein-domain-containing protein [Mycotypha africana]|uniref:snare associated Golgi protein-domain-containing protein n=1 Tax=Mycotypha africana TaxID=64632 RepID=UPI0022FFCB64|nr:snare associated Golgi protein-domain-containing protein [Mycotypha africana]KAI8966929.1 snare associated Golgi protein-domain-containing protein [Mycotypha africana]
MPILIHNDQKLSTNTITEAEATMTTRLLQPSAMAENRIQPRAYSSITSSRPSSLLQPQERSTEREESIIATTRAARPEKVLSVWYWTSKSYFWSLTALITLLLVFTALEYLLLKYNIPPLSPEERKELKFPTNLEDLRKLNAILFVYMDKNYFNVYSTFVITYIYLQSFSIPGSMWLSILGGTLFNFWLTLITVSMCSAIGAGFAYLISGSLGSIAVIHLLGDRLKRWKKELLHHRQHMLNYMIVLRISPFPPNWTVNLGSPHLDVPFKAFFWGTFLGVAPPSFIHVQAGAALERLSASDKLQLLTPINVLCLLAVAIAALVPVFVKRKFDRQQQQQSSVNAPNTTAAATTTSSTATSVSAIV